MAPDSPEGPVHGDSTENDCSILSGFLYQVPFVCSGCQPEDSPREVPYRDCDDLGDVDEVVTQV